MDIASADAGIKKVLPVRVLDKSGKDIKDIIVEPGNVEASIPIENTKRVSLSMDISGQPAEGYVISGISVEPEEVLITGKQQILEDINNIKTERVDITGEKSNITKEVRLMIPNGIEVVDADENVSVSVNIEKIATSEITVKDLEYINLPENLELVSIQGDIKVT